MAVETKPLSFRVDGLGFFTDISQILDGMKKTYILNVKSNPFPQIP